MGWRGPERVEGGRCPLGFGPPGLNPLADLVSPADLVPSIFAIYKIIKCYQELILFHLKVRQ